MVGCSCHKSSPLYPETGAMFFQLDQVAPRSVERTYLIWRWLVPMLAESFPYHTTCRTSLEPIAIEGTRCWKSPTRSIGRLLLSTVQVLPPLLDLATKIW